LNLLIKLELEENNIPFIKLPLYPVLVYFLLNVVLCFNEVLSERWRVRSRDSKVVSTRSTNEAPTS
jgi:hypothetical protein